MNKFFSLFLFLGCVVYPINSLQSKTIWEIGEKDNNCAEFALSPNGYKDYIAHDFGWEDKFFLIGTSNEKTDWPYVIPGTSDTWGGTWGTSGWRSSTLNVLFEVKKLSQTSGWKLTVDILDCNPKNLPYFKITINGKAWKYRIPVIDEKSTLETLPTNSPGYEISIPIPENLIVEGGNEIKFTTLEGSWLRFDQIKLEGPDNVVLAESKNVFLRGVKVADYEILKRRKRAQPLLVDVEYIKGSPKLEVVLDQKEIFSETLETGRYTFEAPMPAVRSAQESVYEIWVDGVKIKTGTITRQPQKMATPADYVNTKMGTAHSRWMIAPGPWMPFSMVKLSPDNQNAGWQSGYEPTFESIGCFSHIHEWTMGGFGTMPTNGRLRTNVGDQKKPDSGYRSRINKETEIGPLGYYSVDLTDYDIKAELTSTTRCGFQRYTYPKDKEGSRVLLDLVIPAEYHYNSVEAYIKKTGNKTVEGFSHQHSPNTWVGGISQEYTVYFVAEFDQPIASFGVWTENGVQDAVDSLHIKGARDAGAIVNFNTSKNNVVQMRTSISYVSLENARENLRKEIAQPFGWNFEAVRQNNIDTWNDIFERVKITTTNSLEKMRFYSNMYRAICSRNTFSDVNGEWIDAKEQKQKMEDPSSPALGCDAFWNSFWNLNLFWNLVTPEWSSRWVKSQLAMYDADGWLAKGPAGMEYIPVMVAEHEIPLIVGAYQMEYVISRWRKLLKR